MKFECASRGVKFRGLCLDYPSIDMINNSATDPTLTFNFLYFCVIFWLRPAIPDRQNINLLFLSFSRPLHLF